VPVVSPSCYELLGVPVDAPRDAVSRAWAERREEAHRRLDSLGESELEAIASQLDEAFHILTDPDASRRYRMYRAQLASGRLVAHPTDMVRPPADEVATDPGRPVPTSPAPLADPDEEDAVTTLDEWLPDDEWSDLDDEDDLERQRTEAMAPAFLGSFGLLAQAVLAVPQRSAEPRPFSRRDAPPPWLSLDPPDPEGMEPPVFRTVPGARAPEHPRAGLRPTLDRPPWEK